MRGTSSVVCVLLCWALLAAPAFGHGVVGKRTFIEPFVTEDANPKNEFVIGRPSEFKSPEGHEFSLGFSLEKKLAESVSLALEGEYRDLSLK
ncbi:MAG: hypothetical protein ACE5I7_14760, partial [Candidatus Binatia bacterium]